MAKKPKDPKSMTEQEMMKALCEIDTPTITNVVATYPGDPLCLSIYNPWTMNWYTDNTLRCWYPEMGAVCGFAVTAVYSVPDPNFKPLNFMEVLDAIDKAPKPSIFVFEQRFPPEIANKVGLAGGNMTSKMMAVGAVGALSNGPSRDIQEIRPMGFQYVTRGICAGHGAQAIQAIQVPVHIAGMDVAPNEIIHMDENGAVKFPRDRLADVYRLAHELFSKEEVQVANVLKAKGKGMAALKKAMGSGDQYTSVKK